MKLNAHFDGKAIVLDDPSSLTLASGTGLRIIVEMIDDANSVTAAPQTFRSLNIHIDPGLSNAIALDPEFNVEEP